MLNLGVGFSTAFERAWFLLIIAYTIFWLYYNGGTTEKAVYPLRHSAFRAILWIYLPVPIIGGVGPNSTGMVPTTTFLVPVVLILSQLIYSFKWAYR